jgi:Domain of unknown function (DUF1877)
MRIHAFCAETMRRLPLAMWRGLRQSSTRLGTPSTTGDSEKTLLSGGVQMKEVSEHCEAHSPEAIRALHHRLSSTSVPAIMANFDAEVFNAKEIYDGPGWDDSDWTRDYIEKHLRTFISVIGQAAGQNKGILVVIC